MLYNMLFNICYLTYPELLYNIQVWLCNIQGVGKVFPELSNKNCDHGSHIQEIQLRKASRLKLCV